MRNLFYCNENESVLKIFILSEENFLGWTFNESSNFLILYNNERLPVDTLLLGNSKNYFLQHLWPLSENQFYVHLLSKMGLCQIENNKFKNCDFWSNIPGMPYMVLTKTNDYTLYVYLANSKGNKEKWRNEYVMEINNEHHNLTKKLRAYDLYHRPDKTIFEFYLSKEMNELILPVEWAKSVIFLNGLTGDYKIKEIPFPLTNNCRGAYYYYDYVKNEHFVLIHKKKSNTFELFLIQDDFKNVKPVGELTFIPEFIQNSKALQSRTIKKAGKAYTCHYLIPLF